MSSEDDKDEQAPSELENEQAPAGPDDDDGGDNDDGSANGEGAPDPTPDPTPARPHPPAMTPAEVVTAERRGESLYRVPCDARCGAERCLYAGNELPADPADPDAGPHPDPQQLLMAAAGCLDDPPTCPGVTGADGHDGAGLDAVAAVASGAAGMAGLPGLSGVADLTTVRRLGPLSGRPRMIGGDPDVLTAARLDVPEPIVLTTAEAHGLTEGAAPDPNALPYATGLGVLDVLRGLGIEAGPLEDVIVEATPEPEPDSEPRPENPDTEG